MKFNPNDMINDLSKEEIVRVRNKLVGVFSYVVVEKLHLIKRERELAFSYHRQKNYEKAVICWKSIITAGEPVLGRTVVETEILNNYQNIVASAYFWLGKGYLGINEIDKAVQAFMKAEKLGYRKATKEVYKLSAIIQNFEEIDFD